MADKTTQKRDPDRTKALLLEKATEVFSEHGFRGGPISQIFKAAGVNKRMIYHYFGDKDGLYRAVLTNQWEELQKWLLDALGEFEDQGAGIQRDQALLFSTLNAFFDFLAHRQDFVRLLMWDGLAGGELSVSIWDEVRGPFFEKIENLIRVAQKDGLIDKDLSPAHFIISFLGSTTFYFAYAPTMSKMLKKDPWSVDALKERKEQLFLQLKHMLR